MNEYDEVKNILIKHDALDKDAEDAVEMGTVYMMNFMNISNPICLMEYRKQEKGNPIYGLQIDLKS
jgi:hypothetical protein